MKKKISITINEKTLQDIDGIVDNIYIRNRSQAIEYLVNNSLGDNKTAVILSGGPEDLLRVSENEYRITAKVNHKTVIEKALKKLRENNFKTIYIIARHNILTSVFNIVKEGNSYGVKINYIEEKESKGTAQSLRLVKGLIKSNFLIVYGDIIFDRINLEELWNSHLKMKGTATLMLTTSPEPSRKGVVKIEGSKILKFEQKPDKSDNYLGFSSILIASPEIFEYSGNWLEQDVFTKLADNGLLYGHLSSEKEKHIHSRKDIKEQNL